MVRLPLPFGYLLNYCYEMSMWVSALVNSSLKCVTFFDFKSHFEVWGLTTFIVIIWLPDYPSFTRYGIWLFGVLQKTVLRFTKQPVVHTHIFAVAS